MVGSRKGAVAIIVVAIAALLLDAGVLYYWQQTDAFVGPQGQRGIQGEQGIQGLQGRPGDPGIKGETGSKGRQGETGPQGPAGVDGEDGQDAPINVPPTITLINVTGYHKYYGYKHNLSVLVEDVDDSDLKITFYYAFFNGSWIQHSIVYGGDGNYTVSQYSGHKTMYWLVEVWDGSDISFEQYEYTVMCYA